MSTNATTAERCLTDADRALLHAVTGWHMPCSPSLVPARDTAGREMLIPVLAWVLADARRQGKIVGEVTPGAFEMAVHAVNRSHSPSLHLTDMQIGSGRRHLNSRFARSVQPRAVVPGVARAGARMADRAAAAAS